MMAADFLFKESHDSATSGPIWGKETNFLTLLKLQLLANNLQNQVIHWIDCEILSSYAFLFTFLFLKASWQINTFSPLAFRIFHLKCCFYWSDSVTILKDFGTPQSTRAKNAAKFSDTIAENLAQQLYKKAIGNYQIN